MFKPRLGGVVGKVQYKDSVREKLKIARQAAKDSGDSITEERINMASGVDNHFGLVKDAVCRTYGQVKDIYTFTTSSDGISKKYLTSERVWDMGFSGVKGKKWPISQDVVLPAQRVPAESIDVTIPNSTVLANIDKCTSAILDAVEKAPPGVVDYCALIIDKVS